MDDVIDDARLTPRRIEVLTGAERRRRWSDEAKARIVAESLAPGAIVAEVARQHDVSAQQLHTWRKDAREGRLVLPGEMSATFAQVIVTRGPPSKLPSPAKSPHPVLEIEVAGLTVQVRSGADANLIEMVLSVLKA
jgi:transposase